MNGMHDFDFLHGSWTIANRKLARPLAGDDEWETFPAAGECRPILNGLGNVDEFLCPDRDFYGATMRLYDQEAGQWSIYWASSRTGRLDPPVLGEFKDGRGDFYGDDSLDGTPIKVHFIWTNETPDSARWEQEFSTDGGQTWVSNWVMDFTRV